MLKLELAGQTILYKNAFEMTYQIHVRGSMGASKQPNGERAAAASSVRERLKVVFLKRDLSSIFSFFRERFRGVSALIYRGHEGMTTGNLVIVRGSKSSSLAEGQRYLQASELSAEKPQLPKIIYRRAFHFSCNVLASNVTHYTKGACEYVETGNSRTNNPLQERI